MSNSKQIVISAPAGGNDFLRELARLISMKGVEIFNPIDDFMLGEAWAETLRREIERATAILVIVPSPTEPNRNSQWFEAGAARALGKRVLAVLPPTGRFSDLPADLADIAVLDADRRPLAEIADMLVQATPESEREAAASET